MARLLMAWPDSPLGKRNVREARTVLPAVADAYDRGLAGLLKLPKATPPPVLGFGPEAQNAILDFAQEIEPRLGAGGRWESMSAWFGKLAGAAARMGALLHLCGRPDLREPWAWPVRPNAAAAGVALGRFYGAHAEAAFKRIGATPESGAALRILAWLKREGLRAFSERDCYKGLGLRAAEVAEPLALLAETDHVREVAPPEREGRGPQGRKPGRHFETNPALFG